jgi:hypothetical protein
VAEFQMQRRLCPTCKLSYPGHLDRCPEDDTLLARQENPSWPWPAGKLIAGRYVIFAETNSNPVTSTYRVRSLDVDEVRSLRALQPAFTSHEVAAREFRRTTRLLRTLHHPNLIRVESAGDAEDGTPFLVTEILPGRSLAEAIAAEAPFDPKRGCSIASQIAEGLSAGHRRGLLHLGLNPSSISISGEPGDEKVQLDEFGAGNVRLSRTANGNGLVALTLGDLAPANAIYCSPEQALATHPEALDARSDLYSLGVVVFEMLTGRLPFSPWISETDSGERARLAWLASRLDGVEPLPAADIANIPEPLCALVRQLLEDRPQLRPASAQHVIEKLRLAQDWMASREMMGIRSGAAVAAQEPPNLVQHEEAADGAEGPEAPLSTPFPALSQSGLEAEPEPLVMIAARPVEPGPSIETPLADLGRAAASASPGLPERTPAGSSISNSTLFKAPPAPPAREWGRWALAVLVLVVAVFGAFLVITHRTSPGPGPLSPVKSDEPQNAAGADSSAAASSSTTKSQPAQAQATSKAESQPETAKPATPSPATGVPSAPSVDPEVAAQVQQAVTDGDIFFEQGKYDLAIQTYARPLTLDPTNKRLRTRIVRAQKAKAAEQRYLGEQ